MLAVTSAAFAMTDAECASAWASADANKDGTVTEAESGRIFAALRVANKPVANGKLTQVAFLAHCKAGLFVTARMEAGAPLAGANNFIESQTEDRAVAAGLTIVSTLTKDPDGMWRGTASAAAKSVNVAIDYKGNVVACDALDVSAFDAAAAERRVP